MAHSGVNRTTKRLQFDWYWPGMMADVRRTIHSCEICQAAKSGGTKHVNTHQRLFAGRPWQKVAIDLVGPMPPTPRGNKWILVLTDHYTRWQDAIAIPDVTAPTIATILDERIFCYLGLPEQLHTDQGVQFESQLMSELCQLWGVHKTHTTPYHPQANGIVERNNRVLGDSLRALLTKRGQDEWDTLLPQIMRAFRGTPHTTTNETANFLMLGRELRLPNQLINLPSPYEELPQHKYVAKIQERLQQAHETLREELIKVRQEDNEEPLLFQPGDLVWLENKRKKRGDNIKLLQKFIVPYNIIGARGNHTYLIEKLGQKSIQNECRLKFYHPCQEETGKAPGKIEPNRRPNILQSTGPKMFLGQRKI